MQRVDSLNTPYGKYGMLGVLGNTLGLALSLILRKIDRGEENPFWDFVTQMKLESSCPNLAWKPY